MEIVVEDLRKVYRGGNVALDGVNLRISKGVFGLVGPNGAGKTTLMRILATLLAPTEGRVTVDGTDLADCSPSVRRAIGYLPQDFRAFPGLKVGEFLHYSAVMQGKLEGKERRDAVETVMEVLGLTEVRTRRIKKLSGGMHRRVGVAQALLGPPELLIVDEPTVGLDPEERIKLRGELSQIGMDRTIILSTHIVGDISSSCARMAILDRGRIVFDDEPSSLMAQADGATWEFDIEDETRIDAVKSDHHIVSTMATGDGLRMRVVGNNPPSADADRVTPTIEDAYVLFMGDRLSNERAAAGDGN